MDSNANKTVVRYRVRKEDVQIQPALKQDGLMICLDCWKTWMGSDDRDLSASRMMLDGGDDEPMRDENGNLIKVSYESDPNEAQRKADMKVGEATGVIIEDLKPCWRWAIYRKCGVSTVWNFPSVDFLSCLADAQAELESKLRVHIATATQFL
jgi:hypothetical protein